MRRLAAGPGFAARLGAETWRLLAFMLLAYALAAVYWLIRRGGR